jgi:hypothetical protein
LDGDASHPAALVSHAVAFNLAIIPARFLPIRRLPTLHVAKILSNHSSNVIIVFEIAAGRRHGLA